MRTFFCRIIALIFILFTSCSSIIFPDFKVKDINYSDDKITVTFSNTPDTVSIKNAFTFIKDDIKEEGTFYFSNNKFIFLPDNKIEKNHKYRIMISTDAEDINGNSLLNTYSYSFSTKESSENPKIINFTQTDKIKITFSNPIKSDTFDKSFSINHSSQYFSIWNSDNTNVEIDFYLPLENNKRYIISINTDLSDIYNNFLKTPYAYTFIYNSSSEKTYYSLSAVSNNTTSINLNQTNDFIKQNSYIKIDFTRQIDFDSLLTNIEIIPEISFTISKNEFTKKEAIINFGSVPSYNSSYIIKIKDKVKDINNNFLDPSESTIIFNNPSDQSLKFITGILQFPDKFILLNENTNYQDIIFPVNIFPTVDNIASPDINLYLIFTCSPDAEYIKILSSIDNIELTKTQNCIDFTPHRIENISKARFYNDTDFNPAFLSLDSSTLNQISDQNLCIVNCTYSVQNNDSNGLIKLNISENLCDNLGNKIDRPTNLSFNKK